jgi:Uncharacterized protein conserved in bacteria
MEQASLTNKESPRLSPTDAASADHNRLYINYVRAIAACAVVQMHTNGAYLYLFDPAAPTQAQFVASDIFYSMLRWATPFFMMISGALMLRVGREEPLGPFLKKRMRRVFTPLLFWGVIYLLYPYRFDILHGHPISLDKLLRTVFYEDIYFHLWFIPMIAGLYILTPVLRVFTKSASRRELEYFLLLIFLFNAGHHFLPGFFLIKHFAWMGYIGYYLLGHYIDRYAFTQGQKRILYPLALAMPALCAWGTWWLSFQKGAYEEKLFVYASPTVLLPSAALFLYLKDFDWRSFSQRFPRIHRAAMYMAGISFGIYFAHPLVLDFLKNGEALPWKINPDTFFNYPLCPALSGPLVAVLAISISVGLVSFLRRLPVVKDWVM